MTRDEHIARLEAQNAEVDRHCAAPESDHGRAYGPGKWTVRQVMAHVADVELINSWRFLRAVAEPGSEVEVFDENVWAEQLDYADRPLRLSRDLFAATRALLIHHVRSLSDETLSRASMHPEKGEMSGWQWAELIHDHAAHHLTQVAAALAGEAWSPPEPGPDSWKYMGLPGPPE